MEEIEEIMMNVGHVGFGHPREKYGKVEFQFILINWK